MQNLVCVSGSLVYILETQLVGELHQKLAQNHLPLLVLHLNLSLVVTELLEQLPLLALGQVLAQQKLCLLAKKLHLRHLGYFLHLVLLLDIAYHILHLLLMLLR